MSAQADLPTFTLDEISSHNQTSDCWILINGEIFDVTKFLSQHPGGSSIIVQAAGKDVTEQFREIHSDRYLSSFLPLECLVGRLAGFSQTPATSPEPPRLKKFYGDNEILALPRTIYQQPEIQKFRLAFRNALERLVIPDYERFESQGFVDPAVWRALVDEGFNLRYAIPKEFGGLGLDDWRYSAVLCEEVEAAGVSSFFLSLQADMVLSYFTKSCSADQQKRWLPRIVKERLILAVAMSEPEVGSDLGKLACTAVKSPDGSFFTLEGRKMWISCGFYCDLVVVSAVTHPEKKQKGISLFVVERGMPGFETAKRFSKLGKGGSDTCLLTFDKVKVPAENLIGLEGEGFLYMMGNLAKERLAIAVSAAAAARRALALTVNYVHGREAFGGTLADLQSVQMKLAKCRVSVQSCTAFVDSCIEQFVAGRLTAEASSMAKVHATEVSNVIIDDCLQCFGGYGYLKKSPIGRLFVDQRVSRIYGGANEVLLEVAGKSLGFRPQRQTSRARL